MLMTECDMAQHRGLRELTISEVEQVSGGKYSRDMCVLTTTGIGMFIGGVLGAGVGSAVGGLAGSWYGYEFCRPDGYYDW